LQSTLAALADLELDLNSERPMLALSRA